MKVYYITVRDAEKISEEYCIKHFQKRFEKSKRFVRREDRLRSIGAGTLLFEVLGAEEEKIKKTKLGKPYIPHDNRFFNLSHSGDYVVLAVSSDNVGIDIEIMEERNIAVSKRVFTEEEQAWLSEDSMKNFHILWTMKESVLKAEGKGMTVSPDSFSILEGVSGAETKLFGRSWYFKSIVFDDYALSVCGSEQIGDVEMIKVTVKG